MQWSTRNSRNVNHHHSSGTSTNIGFFSLQSKCQESMKNLFELQQLISEGKGNVMAGTNGETYEMLFQKAIQSKNECFSRALCPVEYNNGFNCIIDPLRVINGKCEDKLNIVSKCRNNFWEKVLNKDVEEKMKNISKCVESCGVEMNAQGRCLQSYGPERAAEMCAKERFNSEICLGKCLAPPAKKLELENCIKENGVENCKSLTMEMTGIREKEGKSTLLSMGFSNDEIKREGVDVLMDLTGILVMVAFFEEQGK